jgi:Na+-translocating ferredoxin:NAD+ oxidoreductase RnfC subunit
MRDGDRLGNGIFARVLPDVYPIGDEISLIYEASGRQVRPGKLPITAGVIVYNVETMYNLGRAVRFSEPVVDKWVTVGGCVDTPTVVKLPIGTRICELFSRLGITVPEGCSVLDGGPSMGKLINPELYSVTKTTKGILILPDDTQAIISKKINEKMAVARAETACCQCTRCTDLCPRNLLGYPLEPHKMVRTAMGAAEVMPIMVLSATLCCGCGVCESLACSQGISPRAVIANYKGVLAKNKMRFNLDGSYEVRGEREYRMIPSEKWAATLGVAKFDTLPDFRGDLGGFSRVEIRYGAHIGAPAVPVVSDGDTVTRGQLIADDAEGLSVPYHASIDGRVTLADKVIMIDKVI